MRRLFLLFAALAALATPAAAAQPQPPAAIVSVVRDGDSWTADYQFTARPGAWLFPRSALSRVDKVDWRLASWRVLTPGVKLVRAGHYDALVATGGRLPLRIKVRFEPYFDDIETDYDPALAFSDGSVALYDQQFKVIAMKSLDAVAKAPFDSDTIPGAMRPTRTLFRDRAGPVLALGKRVPQAILADTNSYVLFGSAEPRVGPALTMLVDPELPQWLSSYITGEMPKILSDYRTRLGPAPGGTPTLLVSWGGAEPGETSMSGSVLSGMVVMTFLGEGVTEENDNLRNGTRGFIAHESAHFWFGQALSYARVADNWMMEGGADLMAIRAIAAIDPDFAVSERLAKLRSDCVAHLKLGPIGTATERGDAKGPYDCGALFSLVAEQAYGGDLGAFFRALVARNGKDRVLTRQEWIAAVEAKRPGRGIGAAITALVDKPQDDPAAALDALIAKGGLTAMFKPR